MAGASVRQPLTRPCSGRKTLRRCRNNVVTDNVVFIDVDVDGDDVENIIVLDSPELILKKRGGSSGSKVKEHQQRVVICIDDEESFDNKHPDTRVKKRCSISSGASSSMGPNAAENHDQFQKEVSDGTEFVQENIASPVTISKCKRTYSGKAPARNRYGLGPDFDDDFSNVESLDCELVEEDASGSVREQWEKAFSKRNYESRNGQRGVVNCSKISKSSHNAKYSGKRNASEHPKEPPVVSNSERMSCKTGASPSTVAGNIPQDTTFTSKRPCSGDPVSKSLLNEHGPYNKDSSHYGSDYLAEKSSVDCGEEYDHNLKYDGCNFPNAEPEGSSFKPWHSPVEVDPATESSQLREKSEAMKEWFSRSPQEQRDQVSCNSKNGNRNDHSENRDYDVSPAVKNNAPECENDTDPSSKDTNFLDHDFQICTEKLGTRHSKVSSHSTCDINPLPQVDSHLLSETSSSNYVDDVVPLHEKNDNHFGSAESCMIGDREKLKETDVYKKAIEEEWASRRRVLQIQAEEAKQLRRLRKRENAERMRLLDMERRQKQRVEEIRETNKKDEEQMNMKEMIRAEVRNKLSKVEISCRDMASLLRSLGIQVGNELRPNADEVRVACKRALFAFHPDRVSKSNTREQVEAEEKFKLICRMKEKFEVA